MYFSAYRVNKYIGRYYAEPRLLGGGSGCVAPWRMRESNSANKKSHAHSGSIQPTHSDGCAPIREVKPYFLLTTPRSL